ncbi:glycosyltransferase [Xenorhabdus bovienii]|uniref:Glycosyltransferase n=1 Tax=Xenorhabdus bovienii str. feltiae Moldova TaxID=1398200 RepID=A0A077NQ16_XENBV|nr:hypothetical protein [Xenorhabdus bovienii]CDH00508.1 conserved hypothetical protein [Xenorhabdus bovienii str. feltiae Moldova]
MNPFYLKYELAESRIMHKIIVNGVSNKKFIDQNAYDFDEIINERINPESIPDRYYRKGKACWVIQTLINLKYYYTDSLDISLTTEARDDAINILHYDDFGFKTKSWRGKTIVCQADRPSVSGSKHIIVQNPLQAQNGKIFIPHWPQPGLKPRAKDKHEIKNIGFFGHKNALPDFFSDQSLKAELKKRGINFINSHKDLANYTDMDIVISFRKNCDLDLLKKPASKLINAWNADCPLICDDEPSMRAIRLNELDYLIAKTPKQFIEAIDNLINRPDLYLSMVLNGKNRFKEYNREATVNKWINLIKKIHQERKTSKITGVSKLIKFYLHKK